MLNDPRNYETRVDLFRQPTAIEFQAIKEYLRKKFNIIPENVKQDFKDGVSEIVIYGKGEIKKWILEILNKFLKY